MSIKSCVIIGDKPTRFKFGYKEDYAGCKRLKKRLQEQIGELFEKGFHCFWIGGALGVDMWAGEILLRMKEQPGYGEIELYIALPFEGHDTNWDDRSKSRMAFLRKHSAGVVVVGMGKEFPAVCYRNRNKYLLEKADCMIAVYDNDRSIRSDVGEMVSHAEKKEARVILIHPNSGVVLKN